MEGLRYSDRRRLAETGGLGDLLHEEVPDGLALAIRVVVEGADERVTEPFRTALNNELMEHFGVGQRWGSFYSGGENVDAFIDAVEILAEVAAEGVFVNDRSGRRGSTYTPVPDVEERINRAFQRFRFGYRIEGGKVRKIGSPALEETVVGPALLAVQRPGWEEAERSYREAIEHQRAGETDDALTAANAAVEAALKAAGLDGGTLKELARSFKSAGYVPRYLENVPDLLEDLLDRLHAMRSQAGDAHGRAPGAADPEAALADLAVHLAGSFIVYLADVVPPPEEQTA
jgi:hypothetical protein